MKNELNSQPKSDLLDLATAALRDTPVAAGPSPDAVARTKRIPATARPSWMRFPLRQIAACLALVLVSLVAFLLSRESSGIVFADVVAKIDKAHTLTASINDRADRPLKIRLLLKGTTIRQEYTIRTKNTDRAENTDPDLITIIRREAGKESTLQLIPSKRLAKTMQSSTAQTFDLLAVVRNYHTGEEKRLGERDILGRKTQGFSLETSLEGLNRRPWIFWVDKETKLPVQIETEWGVLFDLHFDVPLEDSLFDTKVPAGYTLAPFDNAFGDPWGQLQYAGRIVDERGKPVAGVIVEATDRLDPQYPGGFGGIGEAATTDRDGRFSIDGGSTSADRAVRIEFRHPDLLYGRLENIQLLAPAQRMDLQVRLRDGKMVSGKVIDADGHAVVGAVAEAVYGLPFGGRQGSSEAATDFRKAVATDSDGKFTLRGLLNAPVLVRIRQTKAGSRSLWGQARIKFKPSETAAPVEVVARPMKLPTGKVVHELLGMKLVDVDDDLRLTLGLDARDRVMVLDPGPNSERLGIGHIEQGDSFCIVDETPIKDFNDFAEHLRASCEVQQKRGRTSFSVRVVYNISNVDRAASSTQDMRLTADDLAELKKAPKP